MVSSGLLIVVGVSALAIAGVTMIVVALARGGGRECTACGHTNEASAKFCARCGKPV